MPVRIPAARTSEVLSFGVAGVGAFAPLYLLLAPGAEETLARQTARWAPRWERVAARYVAAPSSARTASPSRACPAPRRRSTGGSAAGWRG
ncbi:hypothetical protein SPI_01689 [Niveomyces insectorum RCEF 264]|uniref:Uncharacterized protein n=1 Tax=Niveomyces insectorum RCEF 264 TaxID=1081102 RepID=A0A167Z5C3_9HYPO|nr:hypothetical protein SPI_01689 [Niveomyces insectorum RCEF 264]